MFNGRHLLPDHQQQLKNRYKFLNQPFNRDELSEERKHLFDPRLANVANEDYRPKMRELGLAELVEMNNERNDGDKLNFNEKLRNLNNLLNRPLRDELIDRRTRSDQTSDKQRLLRESYQPNVLDLINQNFINDFKLSPQYNRQNFDEFIDAFDDEPNKQNAENENDSKNKRNKSSKEVKDEEKLAKQLITNNSNYQPVVDTQNEQQSPKSQIPINRPLRKNKLNRVSKSAKLLGNNVSDCIKNCVSQGILHPVQCHSLC